MANQNDDQDVRRSDDELNDTDRLEPNITGRAVSIEPGPEERLMQLETIDSADTTNPGDRQGGSDIDDRAADAARMDVRRREHSAD